MESANGKIVHTDLTNAVRESSSKAYVIGGISIKFPYQAYPSQITMMNQIIKCLNRKDNCLLESPTGSGKSLALLCACLGWQKKSKKALHDLEIALEANIATAQAEMDAANDSEIKANEARAKELLATLTTESCADGSGEPSNEIDVTLNSTVSSLKIRMQKKEKAKRSIIYIGDDNEEDLEDFQVIKKFRSSIGSPASKPSDHSTSESATLLKQKKSDCMNKTETKPEHSKCSDCPCDKLKSEKGTESENTPMKIPIIYFGTRTHKQVEQIIRELKKTPYRDTPMTILSGRERTCIHHKAMHAENKNEACVELVKAEGGPACHFYKQSKTITHSHPSQLSDAFDLEEFVSICRKARACPYYSSRELLSASEIIFCPYNYLVDPLIRNAMSLNMKGSILVMDEAHNIENSARDAASSSFSLVQLESAVSNLEIVIKTKKETAECYSAIAKILSNVVKWLKANTENLTDYTTYDSSTKVWAGNNLIAIMNILEVGPSSFPDFKKNFEGILEDEKDIGDPETRDNKDELKLLGTTISCLETLLQTLTYMYKSELIYIPDYRLCVTKKKPQFRRQSLPQNPFELLMQFSCLNPAVAFSDLRDITHSIIVASGTLSPLISFESELGVLFKLTMEANHVVANDRMWVGTIGRGPNNTSLCATYNVSETYAFQDDVGNLVFEICSVIFHGVLCFLPSYNMLEKLCTRWQQTGIWEKLESLKVVLAEPRRQRDFEDIIKSFYAAVKEDRRGAILFAVCRGKVSEGLDFADENARAVITIGIPFPNYKEALVNLKRKYNDMHHVQRKLMNGSDWYETQAFRALNQALGRCIRHRNDFGALIIVDERFQKNDHYRNALSKWIRERVEKHSSFSTAMGSLIAFAERTGLKEAPPEGNTVVVL